MFGTAKGKNVIVVSLESLQTFLIGATVNGQEVTPFLNNLRKKVITLITSSIKLVKVKHLMLNS